MNTPPFHPGVLAVCLRRILLALLFCFALPAIAFDAPAFQGDVLDEAGLLAETDRQVLLDRIRTLREQSDIWAAVYVARSLQEDSIEAAAVATFEKWKLGQAGKDNGLLVLIAPAERRMRIEVGYGLEGFITDAFSKRVIEEIYQPAFRESRYADGLMQGFEAMAKMAKGESLPPPAEAAVDIDWSAFLRNYLIAFAVNLAIPVFYLLARAHGRARGRTEADGGEIKGLFILFGFFGLFFGLFFAVFGLAPDDPEVWPMLIGMNALFAGLFSLPFMARARRYLSAAAWRRWKAQQRLMRMRRRSGEKRKIFGVWFDPSQVTVSRGGIKPEPRSSSGSSSSFGSSSSSSSGGGRSGGGGASGSW